MDKLNKLLNEHKDKLWGGGFEHKLWERENDNHSQTMITHKYHIHQGRGEIIHHRITDADIQANGEYTCECGGYEVYDVGEHQIIGHPVFIGDVLDYLNLIDYGLGYVRGTDTDEEATNKILLMRKSIRKPIEEQSDECIKYVYDLIQTIK